MAKNVAKTENKAVAQQGARNAYQDFADEVKQSGIEGSLLRFTKQGDWISGQEEEELPLGTELIMGLNTLKRGWQKWQDNKPVDARMGLVSEGYRPVNRDELGDMDEDNWEDDDTNKGQKRDPWQKTMVCLLKDPKTGDVYTYATSSKSGITALGEAAQVYGNRLQDGEDPESMPIIQLQNSFYKHKTYGKIMIPVFEMTDQWVVPQDIDPVEAKPKKAAAKAKAKAQAAPVKASPANGRVAPKALPAPKKPASTGNRARI
jgi:hypothetical protein